MEQIEVTPEQFDDILDLSKYAGSIAYSKEGIRAYFIQIGPELAKKILATYHTDYRKLRPDHARTLTRDMNAGKWLLDGSPIRLNENGELSDGQHRLNAVIDHDKFIEFLIVDKLPTNAYDTMDTNALTRTYIDVLRRKGYTFAPDRAAIAKLIYRWNKYNSLSTTAKFTVAELDTIHTEHEKDITWAIKNSNGLSRNILARRSVVAFSLYILGQINRTSPIELLSAVSHVDGLQMGTPARALFVRLRNDNNTGRDKLRTNDETVWLIFRAWKTFHQNTFRHEGDQIELNRLNLPDCGVTVSDLKRMLETD